MAPPPPRTPPREEKSDPCQVRIFAQNFPHGKIHDNRKSGTSVDSRRKTLCEPKMNIHNPHGLWKTPVEKPVENVENYELSTGISLLWKFSPACGNRCIIRCIIPFPFHRPSCYVTDAASGTGRKREGKSLQFVKIQCQNLLSFRPGLKFFVKNRQKGFRVSFGRGWEYFDCAKWRVEGKAEKLPSFPLRSTLFHIRRNTCREK